MLLDHQNNYQHEEEQEEDTHGSIMCGYGVAGPCARVADGL